MQDMKQQVADLLRQMDQVNREIAEHWSKAQNAVSSGRLDEAISILNAYFRLKDKFDQVQSNLTGILKGYFADK